MERDLERYYTDFEPPPVAPTFYPTEEDFADPILYVAKIKSSAEKYGLVKIIPPKFPPPFCIDPEKFEFTPRVQRLNEIDALFRLRIIFINKLVKFWQIHGQHFRIPWAENKYIDLYRLQKLVAENGGLRKVSETRRWSHIAKCLGFKSTAGPSLKYHYTKWIQPFELHLSDCNDDTGPSTSEDTKDECKNVPQTRRQSRMMAGLEKRRIKPIPSLDKSSLQDKSDHRTPIELVICAKCGHGDDEARLLLCETCDNSLHIYCANPPLMEVPKGEWRCHTCVTNAVKSVSTDFGFVDSQQIFNLNTFGDWANTFKQQYFKEIPTDVPREKVEAEFWRNVVDIDSVVQVKYGADLISSKVGSGFPRREDSLNGIDFKEKQYYVNHPWNLNNLPKLKESVLCHMHTDISGMMVPWVYVGMCFSTFCWHVEDHWTYSINYNHWGERKIWYGIPGDEAEHFDQVMRESFPELFADQNDLLHHMTTALNPRFLIDKGVPVYSCHQNAGEFVVTFPRAYHAGYNEGLNFAEAVNFAPPDWLRMGRQCLENYASVQRNCVFSHEELLMKMVGYAKKMSISMCLATLEELSWIVSKETEFRKKLSEAGLRESQFCKFEDLSDDDRACAVCRTTLFCSGLVCKHEGRIVCSQHVDRLCDECFIRDSCLKFRYTLEDLVPMVKRLSARTTSYFEWKRSLSQFNNLIEEVYNSQQNGEGEDSMLIKCEHLLINGELLDFHIALKFKKSIKFCLILIKITTSLNRILCRKIRLRDQTICQKVDTRCEYSEVLNLRDQLEKSIFDDDELEIGLKELCAKVDNWKQRVQKCLADEYSGFRSIDALYSLINEAEDEFNIRLDAEGLDELRSVLERYQWIIKAEKLLQQINQFVNIKHEDFEQNGITKNMEEEDEEKHERLSLQNIGKLVIESSRWLQNCQNVANLTRQLEEKFDLGTRTETLATDFLENSSSNNNVGGIEKAEEFWNENFRILCKLFEMNWSWIQLQNFTTNEGLISHLNAINDQRSTLLHALRLANSKRPLKETCVCAKNCGDSPSKSKKSSDGLQNETINCFVCNARFHASCIQWDLFFERLPAGIYLCQRCLRSRRPCIEEVEAACSLPDLPDNSLEKMLVKNLIDHSTRIFQNLHNQLHFIPKGVDLSTIEDETKNKLIDSLIMALSTEVVDVQIYQMLCASAFFDIFPIEQNNVVILQKIRERFPNSNPRPVLFSLFKSPKLIEHSSRQNSNNRRISGIKRRSTNSTTTPKGNRRSSGKASRGGRTSSNSRQNVFKGEEDFLDADFNGMRNEEEDEETSSNYDESGSIKRVSKDHHLERCAADLCLNPYSEYTRWIQCEAGCARWYHFCCVGISVRGAQLISSYCCLKCSSSSSTATTATTSSTSFCNKIVNIEVEIEKQPQQPSTISAEQ
uniref:[histone H3]-trimethyl-L-lysine(4) demethylase n=1 Tax=Meloidogyne enterolobii TaxID=390850 RepID=A0A6V7TRY4_MELEN|nr:unnamed protein product [Meloidogyne enterolobii]